MISVLTILFFSNVCFAEEKPTESEKDPNRSEYAFFPSLTYDTDKGLGAGIAINYVQFSEKKIPFNYRILGLVSANVRQLPGVGLTVPSTIDFVTFDVPQMGSGKLRIVGNFGYIKKDDVPYFGMGNQTIVGYDQYDEGSAGYADEFTKTLYTQRTWLTDVQGQWSIYDQSTLNRKKRLEVIFGGVLRYESPEAPAGSILASDIAFADENEQFASILNGTDPHFLLEFRTGLQWDTRDHEFTPKKGAFHLISNEFSPGVQDDLLFNQVKVDLRWYQALVGDYLVLATRFAGTKFWGTVPFYETGSELSTSVIYGLRGVRYNRYRGTTQALTNIELRSKLWDFNLGSQNFNLGVTFFTDAGRVWNDIDDSFIPNNQQTDNLGIHASVGGGPRLQWGETFILRFDQGYSFTDGGNRALLTLSHAF